MPFEHTLNPRNQAIVARRFRALAADLEQFFNVVIEQEELPPGIYSLDPTRTRLTLMEPQTAHTKESDSQP